MNMQHRLLSLHFKFLLATPTDVGARRYSELSLGIPGAEEVGCFTTKIGYHCDSVSRIF